MRAEREDANAGEADSDSNSGVSVRGIEGKDCMIRNSRGLLSSTMIVSWSRNVQLKVLPLCRETHRYRNTCRDHANCIELSYMKKELRTQSNEI